MDAQWFVVEQGKAAGPLTVDQVGERVGAAAGQPVMVWTAGMAEWADARQLAAFSAPARKKAVSIDHAALIRRAKHEVTEYLGISAYLWICFGALVIYKTAVLRSVGVEFAPMGLALIKALILAKFIMVLQALKIDQRFLRAEAPGTIILQKAALFTLFLIALTVIEEMVVGHIHGKESREILSELAGGTLPQAASIGLLMFLIMIPFFAFRETGVSLWKTRAD